jgi:hypothetical protein
LFKTALARADVRPLRAQLRGSVETPGDEGWELARQSWNLAVDQHPAAVAFPEGAADVQALLAFATRHGATVAPQGPGHGAAALPDLAGSILLRTTDLDGLFIDPERRVARVGAGVLLGDLVAAAADHGLAPVSGSAADVSVAGFVAGGGIGFLSRKLGLAADSVRAVTVVLADGRIVRATADEEPELFWAVRGGGGSFGVVTELELQLYATGDVFAGMSVWPLQRAREVIHAWHAWTQRAPEEATTSLRMIRFPPIDDIPEPFRGASFVIVDGAVLGDAGEAEAILAPLRSMEPVMDTWAAASPAVLTEVHMDPPEPMPVVTDHLMLRELTPAAIDAYLEAAGPASESPLMIVELRHLGGALGRRAADAGALGALDAEFLQFSVGVPAVPDAVDGVAAAFGRIRDALAACTTERACANFADRATTTDELHSSAVAARLRAAKAAYDPQGLLRTGHAVEA